MTREEIKRFVRQAIEGDWDTERMIEKITDRWLEDQAEACQRGVDAVYER